MCNYAMAFDWNTTVVWHNTNSNQDWFDAGNWVHNAGEPAGAIPPDGNTFVVIEPYPGPIINGDAACSALAVLDWSWSGAPSTAVEVNSGDFNAGECIYLASNGTDFTYGDANSVGTAGLTVLGGTVTTPTSVTGNGLYIGGGSTTYQLMNKGVVTMYGGLISVPRVALYHGNIALYGGTLQCIGDNNFIFYQDYPENKIDISGGTLQLAGNYLITSPNLPGLIAGKSIVSTRGNIGIPVFDGTNTILVSDSVNMLRPWGPSPDMNSTNVHYRVGDVNVGIMLSWNSGSEPNVINHDVYFGTSTADISAATITSPQFMHEVNEANAEPNQWDVNNFNFKTNTNYYWRVDDNAITSNIYDGSGNIIGSNTTLYKGLVWKFTSHDGKAYNPNPYNGRNGLTEPLALRWTKGDFATSHMVFVGTDSATVYSATSSTTKVYRSTQTGTSYSLTGLATNWYGPLVPGTTYWWKVTEVNGTTQWGSTGLSGVTAPVLWTFTPSGIITIDDFEDYNNTADVNANWTMGNTIASCYDFTYQTTFPNVIPSGTLTFALDSLGKHGSYYYNAQPFSEVSRFYSGGTIFTGNTNVLSTQPKALRVDYIGASLNAVDPTYNVMYVAIEDTAGHVGVYLNNPNAQLATAWQQWYIPLNDPNFTTNAYPGSVNMAAVSAFHLGFGQRCLFANPGGSAGDGNVMFDNIRLYASTCNPSVTLSADMDGDCDVDINDLSIFAEYWLQKAELRTFATITKPKTPVLWYKFNDTGTTTNVVDYGSTGSYTGTVSNWAALNWDATDGRNGGACYFIQPIPTAGGGSANAQSYVSAPPAAVNFMTDSNHSTPDGGGITVSVWSNASMLADFIVQYPGIWGVWLSDNSAEQVEVPCPSRLTAGAATAQTGLYLHVSPAQPVYYGGLMTYLPLLDFGGRWNHWTWVKGGPDPNGNFRMAIYQDGYNVAEVDTNGLPGDPNAAVGLPMFSTPVGSIHIGTRGTNWAMWSGKLADFQIYDYALSDAEIAYLATDGTGQLLLPLTTKANLKSSGNPATEIVDFQDLAVMGNEWHQIQLWP